LPLPAALWFHVLFYPFVWVLNHAAFWLLRRFGLQPVSEAELSHSEEEIRLLLAETRRHTSGPTLGQDIALNAFALESVVIPAINTANRIEGILSIAEH
jgi:CBS domain containing-hemolysin-like protein